MKNWIGIGCISSLLVLGSFSSPSSLLANNFVEALEKGKIDWSNRIIEAVGVGRPPKNPLNIAQARAVAKKAAIDAAQQNLLKTLEGVQIDVNTQAKKFVTQDDPIQTQVRNFIQHSQIVDISYLANGSVKATVAIKLTGPFADLLLPKSIRDTHPVRQPGLPVNQKGKAWTGLLLDCRGLEIRPAMVLRIVDEDGNELYGPKYINRKCAVQHGMTGYTSGLKAAAKNLRVGNNPISIKAIRAEKSGSSDIVISNSDADTIRRDPRNLKFLQECRVMVVLD